MVMHTDASRPRRIGPSQGAAFATAVLVSLLLAALGAALGAPPARADVAGDVDDFSYDSLDVRYELSRTDDGASRLHVTERLVARFPDFDQNRGMLRTLPDDYLGQPLRPTLLSVTDGEGNPRPSETEDVEGGVAFVSRDDDYLRGVQVFVFEYELQNVIGAFADSTGADEFQWNIVGGEGTQPYGSVTATLAMDASLRGALTGDAACYRGPVGSTDRCEIEAAGDEIVASTGPLPGSQAMTMAVGFAAGTFETFDTNPLSTATGWLQIGFGGLAVAGLVAAVVNRRRFLRDDAGRATIVAEYAPPPGVDALHAAVLRGKDAKGIPAEVLEQAIVGSIRIVEERKGLTRKHVLVAEYIGDERADDDGRMLLRGLFGDDPQPGDRFRFGSSDTRLSKTATTIIAQAKKDLGSRGLYRHVPATAYVVPVVLLLAGAAGAVACGIVLAARGFSAAAVAIALIAGMGVVVAGVFAIARKPLASEGAEARDHLEGLRVFIEWAEADRIRMLQSPEGARRVDTDDASQVLELYETLLPYAVVFGQEKKWAEVLTSYAASAGWTWVPAWYVGSGPFSASSFASGIGSLSTVTSTASSTGGSTGGGSAGGGGGGGGTGGV